MERIRVNLEFLMAEMTEKLSEFRLFERSEFTESLSLSAIFAIRNP